MKYVNRFLLTLAAVITIGATSAQTSSAEATVQKMFAAFKAKDKNAFLALYPNAKQFGGMMRSMMKAAMNNEEVRKQMSSNPQTAGMNLDSLVEMQLGQLERPEVFAQISKDFADGYEKAINQGEDKGVNWSNATLTSYTIDSTAGLGEELESLRSQGFKAMKGNMEFRSGTQDYTLSFDKVLWMPGDGKWLGGEFGNVLRKGEVEEVTTEPMSDSMMLADSVVMAQEVPAQKTKSKTKTPTGKTKTKTKPAARKP